MLFFELLQVAIGNRPSLSIIPDEEQWKELFALAKKQALVGICYAGILKLPKEQMPSQMFLLKWVGLATKIKEKNTYLNERCKEVCIHFIHEGFYSCILKGQGNLCNYPEDLRMLRNPGDIDVCVRNLSLPLKGRSPKSKGISIVFSNVDGKGTRNKYYSGIRGVIEYVLMQHRLVGTEKPKVNYHHVDWEVKGVPVEVHFRPSWMNCPWHNRRLQRWCKDYEKWNACKFDGFNIPSVAFNVVYQLVHIYRHLFNEGIGMRQLLDYYFVLRALHMKTPSITLKGGNLDGNSFYEEDFVVLNEGIMHTLSRFGMKKFAGAVMYVLQKVLAMPSEYLLCAPDERRGEFLLNEIMLAGNFGKYDKRNVISANEGYMKRFVRRQKRFVRFLSQYPSEVIWGPYFSSKQRMWRIWHGWR